MTNILGIVAEYNPFHNGHRYQLTQAQQRTDADLTVVVMSGNWAQRGEPTILDKWQRTRLALTAGVDLVVELPFQFAVQPAHLFANGAVQLLSTLGCTSLAFGAEHPELDFETLVAHQPNDETEHFKRYDETYPTLFNDYLQAQTGIDLRSSNDILGFSYVNANQRLESPLSVVPIQRLGSAHQTTKITASDQLVSGAAIRQALSQENWYQVAQFVPDETLNLLKSHQLVTWQNYWSLLKYQILTQRLSSLHDIYQMSEGIEYRLKRAALQANDFETFIRLAKTKRFTYARLQRLCVYILLQVQQLMPVNQLKYIRVLGFNELGQKHLSGLKKQVSLPIISRITDEWIAGPYRLDYQAGILRQMISGIDQDRMRHPIVFHKS